MYTNELAMICHKCKVLEEKHPAKFPPVQSNCDYSNITLLQTKCGSKYVFVEHVNTAVR